MPDMQELGPIIATIALILFDILLLKLALLITKAQEKKNMKWVAISFGIQFGVIFFVGSPLIIYGMVGRFQGDPGIIIPVVIFSVFIDLNVINLIHKIGLKRSFVVMFFVVGPIITALYLLGSALGGTLIY
ncbi:MAG: hypothetical protein ACFE9I_03715 [Candidatus Hermodarchaeota archaeon]